MWVWREVHWYKEGEGKTMSTKKKKKKKKTTTTTTTTTKTAHRWRGEGMVHSTRERITHTCTGHARAC